jgi:hypothetical protein
MAQTPSQARKAYAKLMEQESFTPKEMKLKDKLEVLSRKDVPGLQHWILSSAGPPRNGWTTAKWDKFQKSIRQMESAIEDPIYRGTKLPWILGREKTEFKTSDQVEQAIAEFHQSFDAKTHVRLNRALSWTKLLESADGFANEAKGHELVPGWSYGDGFIHVIEPPLEALDVFEEMQHATKLVKLPGSDELEAARVEQEVLMAPGTVLEPICREDRFFMWRIVKSHKRRKVSKK